MFVLIVLLNTDWIFYIMVYLHICVRTKVNKEKQQRSAVSYARKSQINPYQQHNKAQ